MIKKFMFAMVNAVTFLSLLEDELNFDKRRAAVGLQPLEQYAKLLGFECVPVSERNA